MILTLALILRFILFLSYNPFSETYDSRIIIGDANGYQILAKDIVNRQAYGEDSEFLSMIRTPGYPLYLAAIYTIFGTKVWLAILFQIIIDSFIVLLIINSGTLLLPNVNFNIAGLLWAVDPFAIIYSNQLLSDSLFVFFIVLGFYFISRYFKQPEFKDLVIAGVSLSIAVLIRPVGLYLYFIFAIFLLIRTPVITRQKLVHISIFLIILLIFITPWIVRNKLIHDHYFYSISGAYNSLILYSAPVISIKEDIPLKEAKIVLAEKIKNEYSSNDSYEYYQNFQKEAKKIISSNKWFFVKSYIWGILDMYFSVERNSLARILNTDLSQHDIIDTLQNEGFAKTIKFLSTTISGFILVVIISILFLFLSEYLLTIIGSIILIKNRYIFELILILIPIIYFSFIIGSAGLGRFKLSIIPFYLFLVAIPINSLLLKFNKMSIK